VRDGGLDSEARRSRRTVRCAAVVYPEGLISTGYWDRWTDPAYFSLSVEWDVSTLRAFNANLAVHDGRPSVGSAAARFGIPVTSVLQSLHLPGHRYAGRASEQIWTDMADSLGAGRLVDGRELLAVGGVGVPSVPQIDQVPKGFRGKVTYLGPLTGRQTPSGPTSPDGHRTLFYGVVPESDDVDAFLGAFADLGPSLSVAWGANAPDAAGADVTCDRCRLLGAGLRRCTCFVRQRGLSRRPRHNFAAPSVRPHRGCPAWGKPRAVGECARPPAPRACSNHRDQR